MRNAAKVFSFSRYVPGKACDFLSLRSRASAEPDRATTGSLQQGIADRVAAPAYQDHAGYTGTTRRRPSRHSENRTTESVSRRMRVPPTTPAGRSAFVSAGVRL